jgi:epoxyqueuosine reductase
MNKDQLQQLAEHIGSWSKELGFDAYGITDLDVSAERSAYEGWIEKKYNASMSWLEQNQELRFSPEKLVEGSCRVISVRLDYMTDTTDKVRTLKNESAAYVSRYALGRDYHKVLRKRLAKLAQNIEQFANEHGYQDTLVSRAFVDSAPVLERPLAEKAGLGWTGKHTLILNEQGSWFFLGELFTNISLPINTIKPENKCGDCEACLRICPTDAFPAPYQLDARRCISYLTIEHKGSIPIEFREAIGNRIFGCDDCQLVCPWNKYANFSDETDFKPRHNLDSEELINLYHWTEQEFLDKTQGSAIRRAGYASWRRNISIALGNAPSDIRIIEALKTTREQADPELCEHIDWALERQHSSRRRKRKVKNSAKS